MWIAIAVIITISLTVALMLLIFAVMQRRRNEITNYNEYFALRSVTAGISERLHAAYPNSKWRWVCRPDRFAINGGIARIDVIDAKGEQFFVDVCLSSVNDYLALHISNAVELMASDTAATDNESQVNIEDNHLPSATPLTGAKPHNEESVTKWYNIVLIGTLTALIDDLNAKEEICVYIGQDGKAYIDEINCIAVVYDFGEMPDTALWGYIIESLGKEGLFAEVREENCIFISWA